MSEKELHPVHRPMKITYDLYLEFKQAGNLLDKYGREIADPRPVAVPSGLQRPLSLKEQVQRLMREELSTQAMMQGRESFEEADDFDVEDGFDTDMVASKYELVQDEFPVRDEVEPSVVSRETLGEGEAHTPAEPAHQPGKESMAPAEETKK